MCNGESGFGSWGFHTSRVGHNTYPFVANLREMVAHIYRSGERERERSCREKTINNSAHMSH